MKPVRPKGMPRAEWDAASNKQKARWSFIKITTNQHNSGVQQYGAGQKYNAPPPARVPKASAKKSMMGMEPVTNPISHVGPKGTTHISQRESLGEVEANGLSFSVQSFPMQPGFSFPWGSKSAANYVSYRVKSMRYFFVPSVSAFAESGQIGRVCLAFNYDALEGPPSDMIRMESLDPNVVGMAYTPLELRLDSRRATLNPKYVRIGPTAGDLKTYDFGALHFGTQGFIDTQPIGEIFVEYDIELLTPQIGEPSLVPAQNVAVIDTIATTYNSVTLPIVLGGGWVSALNTTTLNLGAGANDWLRFPRGHYLITMQALFTRFGGSGAGLAAAAIYLTNNASIANQTTVATHTMMTVGPAQGWIQQVKLEGTTLLAVDQESENYWFATSAIPVSPDPSINTTQIRWIVTLVG